MKFQKATSMKTILTALDWRDNVYYHNLKEHFWAMDLTRPQSRREKRKDTKVERRSRETNQEDELKRTKD